MPVNRIYYARKTGRGRVCTTYGRGRAVHRLKKGGSAPLLLAPGLGASNGPSSFTGSGVSRASEKKDEYEKLPLSNVISKLEKLQISDGRKRKNVNFMV